METHGFQENSNTQFSLFSILMLARWDSNPQPSMYKNDALPVELLASDFYVAFFAHINPLTIYFNTVHAVLLGDFTAFCTFGGEGGNHIRSFTRLK